MKDGMRLFLIVYDRRMHRIVDIQEYSAQDRLKAQTDRFMRELQEVGHPEIEVVLLGADSLETIKGTHSRYFMEEESIRGTYVW